MKVRLSKEGRLVPGSSHPYWEANLDDWRSLRKKESVDVNVQEFSLVSEDDDKKRYETREKDKSLKWNEEGFFFYKNPGLEKVSGGNLKDRMKKEGGEN